jgi:DNA repair protein RadC
LYGIALKVRASSVIVAHNHPSGNLTPSRADIDHTNQLAEAGRILGIPLRDHLILSATGYVALSDQGLV